MKMAADRKSCCQIATCGFLTFFIDRETRTDKAKGEKFFFLSEKQKKSVLQHTTTHFLLKTTLAHGQADQILIKS